MVRAAALVLAAVLAACSGRSTQNGSGGADASSAGSSGDLAMAGSSAAMAGSSSTSGGNAPVGEGGRPPEGGGSSTAGAASGAPTAGSAAGGVDGEAGATSGEGGSGTSPDCPAGCAARSEPFCEGGGITWVCDGAGPIDYDALVDGGCMDLFTQVPRFCCPASFRPECQ